jgi:hypothetical protein
MFVNMSIRHFAPMALIGLVLCCLGGLTAAAQETDPLPSWN